MPPRVPCRGWFDVPSFATQFVLNELEEIDGIVDAVQYFFFADRIVGQIIVNDVVSQFPDSVDMWSPSIDASQVGLRESQGQDEV